MPIGLSLGLALGSGGGVSVSPQVAQYYARLTAGESAAFMTAVAGFINPLVSPGTWGRTDWCYFLHATVRSNAFLNAKSALYPFTQVGLPDGQHTPGLGVTGDGNIAHYLDNGCDPTVAPGLNFSLNAAAIVVYVSAGAKSGDQFLFGNGNFYMEPYFSGDTLTYWRAHGAGDLTVASPASLVGLWGNLRTSAGASQLRVEGVDLATSAAASSAVKNQTLRAFGGLDASTYTGRLIMGGAYTQADYDLIRSLL